MMARSFFERSKQMPLHIDMARDTTRTMNSLAELRKQSDRIVTLKLRRWLIQKMFLSESLPSLKRLEVFLDYDDDDSDEEWDTTWTSVWGPTEKATSWSFPSLTTLVVYVLNPIPFYTPNLTCFKFWDQEDYTDVNKLVRFLENCPLLQHINISCVQEPESEHDLVVSLPNLRTYTQTASGERDFLEVLNMFSLPPSCSVKLRFPGYGGTTVRFKNPNYLAEIKRVKLRMVHSADENEVTGTLELINAEGTKVCFEGAVFGDEEYWLLAQGNAHDVTHLDFLRSLDRLSVETLCIDGYLLWGDGKAAVEFFKEVLGFGNVGTLILSRSAARVCLTALDQDPGASNDSPRFLPIDTIIIYTDSALLGLSYEVFQPLLRVAQKREVAGFPFKSVSLFHSERSSGWLYDHDLDELKRCVGKLEVVIGEDALDWNVDKYFLDGLEHLQQNRDVQWD